MMKTGKHVDLHVQLGLKVHEIASEKITLHVCDLLQETCGWNCFISISSARESNY